MNIIFDIIPAVHFACFVELIMRIVNVVSIHVALGNFTYKSKIKYPGTSTLIMTLISCIQCLQLLFCVPWTWQGLAAVET